MNLFLFYMFSISWKYNFYLFIYDCFLAEESTDMCISTMQDVGELGKPLAIDMLQL